MPCHGRVSTTIIKNAVGRLHCLDSTAGPTVGANGRAGPCAQCHARLRQYELLQRTTQLPNRHGTPRKKHDTATVRVVKTVPSFHEAACE
ncbi:hypothetical protein IF1G_02713 [Cordyceps javanica]|uniref:Uncharacterized protein n=1 Tax=Cordyceps javanica TaxID=43265 RepID=A0A545W7E1_9HYPO|nr:hypothetical protein IF1G_02713 [Cordyceps javanica]TQW09848.1 hypothetical protein IF2G_02638 [Cordyceps javanica]